MKKPPPKKIKTAVIHGRKTLLEARPFKIVEENITLPNGVATDVIFLKHPGASAIVPFTSDKNLIMIRQYRHCLGEFITEIPAGTRNPGEDFEACAKRELEEETGYRSDNLHSLGEIATVPGYSDERIHLFIAEDLIEGKPHPENDEVLNIIKINFDHAMEMIYEGTIKDSKTICGLLLAERYFLKKRKGECG
jgi:ADP-ribose pyrophosphatase